jgi:thermostable 8-oxoguanine DNA glycosylase
MVLLVQYVSYDSGSGVRVLKLPDSGDEVLPGLKWGSVSDYFTPAFWKAFAWKSEGRYLPRSFGGSLREELAACMLCGYGIQSEVGVAAFHRLKKLNLLEGAQSAECLQDALAEPLALNGRLVRYRFFRAKAAALAIALREFDALDLALCDTAIQVRELLMTLPGVGPKTASYAVRNHFGSDEVAVLDIHITRASKMLSIFPQTADPQRHYFKLERLFLDFARALGVRASVLDNLMWDGMRTLEPSTRSRTA